MFLLNRLNTMDELNVLTKISELIESLPADAQRRSLAFLNDKYGSTKISEGKKQFAIVDGLDLNPVGRNSARRFTQAYQLRRENKQIKCLLAVYYLSDYLNDPSLANEEEINRSEPVTVDHVATFFHEVEWELPTNLSNTISQSSRSGWIDNSSMTDLKTTDKGKSLLDDVWEPTYAEIFNSRTVLLEPAR